MKTQAAFSKVVKLFDTNYCRTTKHSYEKRDRDQSNPAMVCINK